MPIRLMHVGLGVRGRHWLEVVRRRSDLTLAACVDPDPQALAAARTLAPGAGAFADLDQALRAVPADAALVTSPTRFHAEHARRALEAGLHVLVEKPFATALADAEAVVAAAGAAGRQVVVAENYRFFPAERTVHRWIAGGRIGRPVTVTCLDRRCQPPSDLGPWAASLPHPQLVEIAVHHFDSFRYLLDRRPARVTARTFNPPGSAYHAGAGTGAVIEMEDGPTILYGGFLTSHRYEYTLWIEGEAGALWTDRRRVWWRRRGARFFRPVRLEPAADRNGARYPWAGMTALLDQFRDAVLHGRPPETGGRDNLWTVAMVEAALRSAEDGAPVAIAAVDGAPVLSAGPGVEAAR